MQLRNSRSVAVVLGPLLGKGGEAEIYDVPHTPSVAKLYHEAQRTAERRRKLEVMIAAPPDDPARAQGHVSIAWPTEIVTDARGSFMGFLMPRIDHFSKLIDVYSMTSYPKGLTWADLLLVARNLTAALKAIHDRGYIVGDLNESNILVASNDLVTFVDCDSMQVRDPASGQVFRCPVGKAEYSAPELQGVYFATVERTPECDAFALAVVIGQLLLLGTHPFAGISKRAAGGNPRIEDNIAGQVCFLFSSDAQPPSGAPPLTVLPPEVLRLLVRCFREGHATPALRPIPDQWLPVLENTRKNLKTCRQNQIHRYAGHLGSCPWCEYERQHGFDPFTYRWARSSFAPGRTGASQIPAPPPAAPTRARGVRIAATALAAAAALALGVWLWPDRSPDVTTVPQPPPAHASETVYPLRDPTELIGFYSGLMRRSSGGDPVLLTLDIRNVSPGPDGEASFQYTLNTREERRDGIGKVQLQDGLVLLSPQEVFQPVTGPGNRLALKGKNSTLRRSSRR